MNQPSMCPFCGTRKFMRLDNGKRVSPDVNGEVNQCVSLLVFSCESGHVFITIDQTQESVDAIANGPLYERHRNN